MTVLCKLYKKTIILQNKFDRVFYKWYNMDMKIVIVGAGKVGEKLIEILSLENHDIVVVDLNAKRVETLVNKYDVFGVVGSGSQREILLEAGVDKADFFISSASVDEFNIVSCVLAKSLGAKYTIARIRAPEYFTQTDNMKQSLGVDLPFNPEYRTAVEISQILKFPSATKIEVFADGLAKIIEFHIEKNNSIVGKSIVQIVKELGLNVLFSLIKRGEQCIIPRGETVIETGDDITVIGTEAEILTFTKKINIFKPSAKSVFIVGGGKVSYYLATLLAPTQAQVKILEVNEDRCQFLSEELSFATILCGDATEQEILDEEDFDKADACVTLTGMDEQNVVLSIYALQKGAKKVITNVDRPSVMNMVKVFGLDTVLSPREVIANHVLRFIRSKQTSSLTRVKSLYRLSSTVEALEFVVGNGFKYVDIPLKDLEISKDVIIAGVIRNQDFIKAGGETTFKVGDRVLVVSATKSLTALEEILK